jgi:hypothetical protein
LEVSPEAVRSVLARSAWGDPASVNPAGVLLGMRLAWARRVTVEVPEAAGWARKAVSVLWSRLAADRLEGGLGSAAQGDMERVLGASAYAVGPPVPSPRPWAAQAEWWNEVEEESRSMAAAGDAGTACTVGMVGLLAADAWRTGAALGLAGRQDEDPELKALIVAEA